MKRGFKIVLFAFILLLTINIVSALEVNYEVNQGEVLRGEHPSYTIVLNNNEREDLDITLTSVDLNWLLDQDNTKIIVAQGNTQRITLTFRQIGPSLRPANYGIQLKVSTPTTPQKIILPVRLLEYTEVLDSDFETVTTVDPRKNSIIHLNITNKNNLKIEGLTLTLSSDHFEFTQDLNLNSLETKTLEFQTTPKDDTIEGTYNARALIKQGDIVFLDKDINYQISRFDNLKEITEDAGSFLISSEKTTLKNEGNSPVPKTYTKQFSTITYKLASFTPQPYSVVSNDEGYLVTWQLTINPAEQQEIIYEVNYRTPIIVVFVIALIFVGLYIFRKKNAITVEKRVLSMHGEVGNNVHIVKVVINIRNRGSTTINNLRIMDRVPNMIKAPAQHGALRPTSVKATPDGTIMIWDIASVRPREEKILSYRLEGKMQVLGSMRLPPVRAKYTLFGRTVVATSNAASLKEK